MSRKALPYKTDSEYDIMNVIKLRHEIPYHSRPFMWNRSKHIETVVHECLQKWKDNSLHWLGFLIIYNSASLPAITDGQHRVTVCFLMMLALAEILKKDEPLQIISRYGTSSMLAEDIEADDKAIMDKYEWARFPNLHSVYDYDFEALGNLLNQKPAGEEAQSKLYEAYDDIKDILESALSTPKECIDFYRFLNYDVKITRMVITDWSFALTAFNALNNIKVRVPSSFLLKNLFTTAIGESRGEEVHTIFRSWELQEGPRNYEAFIHRMVNMWSKKLMSFDDYESYLASSPVLPASSFADFCKCVSQGTQYKTFIEEDRFGKILMTFMSGHEIMSLCLLPLCFIAGSESVGKIRTLLRQLVAYGIRQDRKLSFNPIKYQDVVRSLISSAFNGIKTLDTTLHSLTIHLNEWLPEATTIKERLATELYKNSAFRKARCTLLYLAEATDHHEASLNHTMVHIDHIHAQTRRKSDPGLAEKDNKHRLGNLTPLCGSNSASGLKGNSALSNKPFADKLASYAGSNIAMTRDVATVYAVSGFLDAQIEERSWTLASKIEEITAADLAL